MQPRDAEQHEAKGVNGTDAIETLPVRRREANHTRVERVADVEESGEGGAGNKDNALVLQPNNAQRPNRQRHHRDARRQDAGGARQRQRRLQPRPRNTRAALVPARTAGALRTTQKTRAAHEFCVNEETRLVIAAPGSVHCKCEPQQLPAGQLNSSLTCVVNLPMIQFKRGF